MRAETLARAEGLFVSGVVADGGDTVLLLSPDEPRYWDILRAAPEWRDGSPNPVDRWSLRVIGALAEALGGEPLFPFGGPPWHPFYTWALAGGRAVASPVSLLADAERGLWISYRGAIRVREFEDEFALRSRSRDRDPIPASGSDPCSPCPAPCRTACPVNALTEKGYDVAACHGYLDTEAGADCLTGGCLVRRACPVGRDRRPTELAAYHMGVFHR